MADRYYDGPKGKNYPPLDNGRLEKDTIEKFKKIVLAKHGKLEVSVEEEEALKLYIKKYERLLGVLCPPDEDPLAKICGIGRSDEKHNVLRDLERLEAGELWSSSTQHFGFEMQI